MTAGKALSRKDMNGHKVENVGTPTASGDAATKVYVDDGDTAARDRANHTGSQVASTISNFDAQVRTSRLDQMATPTAAVPFGGQKITGLADPTAAQEGATKAYVDAQFSGVASGQITKGTVRVATTTNVNLAAPGATLDGIAMAAGDLFLATGQTVGTENGPYVWNGAATAATRATNWDTDADAALGSYWIVREGSKAEHFALLANDTAITLGTTVPTFVFQGQTGGRYAEDCPAVGAGGTWTVTHNLNSRDVTVQVRRVAAPYDYVDVYIAAATLDTVAVQPDSALAAAEYRAIVKF